MSAKKATATKKIVRKKKTPPPRETVLVLRTCSAEMKSYNGFTWPASGPVEATDWNPVATCGQGLHGWLWGAGDWGLKAKGDDIKWLVVEVLRADIIDLVGKVKFPRGNVIACVEHWRDAMAVISRRLVETLPASAKQIATKEGEVASATGYSGHASATGNSGHASATGNSGHASATGYSGHASATGDSGHASATGNYGWGIAGYAGRAKAGKDGVLTILWFDEKAKRPRVVVGYVGEDGIKAGTWYQVVNGKLVKVTS